MNCFPRGVSILACLHLIGGVVLLGLQIFLALNMDQWSANLNEVGIPPTLLIIGMMIIAVVGIAAGIGMWRGKAWGWWCGAFYYV